MWRAKTMAKKWKTMDGNAAASHVSYAFTEVAAIFPITPSSNMAENVDEMAAEGKKNIFGQTVKVVEMQSEAGAAGAVHGSLQAGALTTTYTASQGLLLMVPNMYKIAGELLPCVFHVSARAIAASSLSIFGDHQDVMATRQTGFALLSESSVQEVMDLAGVAHLSAIKGRVPFINFFDGFRTSHEIQKVELMNYDDLAKLVDYEALNEFRRNALNPDHPVTRGTAQNPDIYFQSREAVNKYYLALPEVVEGYMQEINKITGRNYQLFNYHGAADAEHVIIAMGSACETIKDTVDFLNANGAKVGMLNVHLYRPFSIKHFLGAMPATVKKIAVLDRTKEPGSLAEPLYLDVCAAYYESDSRPLIVGGRYGLGSKEFLPADVLSVFENLKADKPKNNFTVGIVDDITATSLPKAEDIDVTAAGTTACKFWGLGSDGTVGANKSAIKIIGDHTDMYAQGYFAYDSKKSGGITVSHLRFGQKPITCPYLVDKADFIACHNQAYVHKYNVLSGLKKGGIFLLNTIWNAADLEQELPAAMKQYIAKKNIKFYTLDAVKIASEIGLGARINMIMQSAFFKLTNIIPVEDAVKYLKEAVNASYGLKGQKVLDMNYAAIDQGVSAMVAIDVPAAWAEAVDAPKVAECTACKPDFIKNVMDPMTAMEGDSLPVSTFENCADGTFPCGTAAYEKRGIAVNTPEWQIDKCIQCNQCAFVCPHAAIRPVLMTEAEAAQAPAGFDSKPATGVAGHKYRIAISPMDCTGCGNCAQVCIAKEKALVMKPIATQETAAKNWDFAVGVSTKSQANKYTVKNSQFEKPLLEFSGACAGCGETPYVKLVTQLFGDRMMIANATGCSSIWGASAPSTPYTKNSCGHGPSWANSLFEDNAEYGLGQFLGANQIRNGVLIKLQAAAQEATGELKVALDDVIANFNNGEGSRARVDKLIAELEQAKAGNALLEDIYNNKDYIVKRSHWIFGGDGWAYDIGYGGLDHVLASGEDVNVLVLDTEVYSNTGGQSSKSTPTAAIAKFAASGKKTKKKDLGMMAMSYGYVYVAQIAMGADKAQTLKAIQEAEAYPGPSLIIAYAPCINHGLKVGMGQSQEQIKRAVEAGYWATYRYNPQLKEAGKNPFSLDSKAPTANFKDFLMSEVRYSSLKIQYPEIADQLFAKTEKDAAERLAGYKKLAEQN